MSSKKTSSYPELYFFVKIILVYVSWKLLDAYICRSPASSAAWQELLLGYEHLYAALTCFFLRSLGYPSWSTGIYMYITPLHFTYVADHCLAIPAMYVFAFSVLIFPGKWKDKIWFIPLGLFAIFCINLFRLVSLCVVMIYVSESTYQVYHRFIFLGITYGVILAILFWWMNRSMKSDVL